MTDKLILSNTDVLLLKKKVEEQLNTSSLQDLLKPLSDEELAEIKEIKEYIHELYGFSPIPRNK